MSLWEMVLYLISFQQRTCDSSCVTSSEIAESFAVGFANRALSYHSAVGLVKPSSNLSGFLLTLLRLMLPLLLQSRFVAAQELSLLFWGGGGCSCY